MEQWNNYKRPAEEQEYSDNVQQGSTDMEPTRAELADLSTACNKLWELDLNRLTPGTDYQIDCGDGKKVYQKEDMAEGKVQYYKINKKFGLSFSKTVFEEILKKFMLGLCF